MAYIINKFSGEQLIVLEDGTIDTSTSLGLVGRNYVGYGETQNENFIFLLENFAGDSPPQRPLVGQLWFDTDTRLANVYDGINWNPIGVKLSETEPIDPNAGSLWLDTTSDQLNVYNGAEWGLVGPEAVAGFGITRARSTSLIDTIGNAHPVIFFEIDDVVIAIGSSEAFVINSTNSVPRFANALSAGITMAVGYGIEGNLIGNASSADKLSNARLINGVPFDGLSDITVKASTTNKLIKGTYIVGSDFDGSTPTTWSVDASSANQIGKVVARNSTGGFSAGIITADLVGNVTGNVTAVSGTSIFDTVQATVFVGATLTGNANSATQLATPRQINEVIFDGTANITVPAAAETLTGNTLNSTVTQSSLVSLGTLNSLFVADAGISIGSAGTLKFLVESARPTLRSTSGTLNFDMGTSGPDVSFVDSATSLSLGGPSAPAIIGDNTTNLGITGYKFNNIYANNLFGNADTATLAITATNLAGGGLGAIPFQTAAGTTSMLGLGTAGTVLTAGAGGLSWQSVSREPLTRGSFLTLVNSTTSGAIASYDGVVSATIAVDATSTNTASKIVARDANGNFAAGTVSANLSLPVSGLISWPNDQYGGSGDIARIETYSGGGEALRLRLYVNNDPDDIIELDASGGVLVTRGNITAAAAPTSGSHIANKTYVDAAIAGAKYYDIFSNGVQSPGPQSFPERTIRGFSAYSSTDFPGEYFGGITVNGPSGVYSGQIAFNWNSEESAPTGLYFRVNDDTSNTAAWSPWRQVATVITQPQFTFGNTIFSTSGFTNQVGSFNDSRNHFDVFPPAGKTMGNLTAFIPSIAVIHYAGGVDANDSMRCTWSAFGDRIRVYVQNTEQRSTPAANYLAIWS
jgi:hypothetical protein